MPGGSMLRHRNAARPTRRPTSRSSSCSTVRGPGECAGYARMCGRRVRDVLPARAPRQPRPFHGRGAREGLISEGGVTSFRRRRQY
jgi:hypothetical protein